MTSDLGIVYALEHIHEFKHTRLPMVNAYEVEATLKQRCMVDIIYFQMVFARPMVAYRQYVLSLNDSRSC